MNRNKIAHLTLTLLWLLPVSGCLATSPPPPDKATPAFDYVSRINEPSAKALYFYSLARMHMAEKQWAPAAEALAKAVALAPDDPEIQVLYGEVLGRMGKESEAMTALEAALKLNPDLPEAHLLLGQLLGRAGKPEEAIEHLKTALGEDPKNQKLVIQLAMMYANAGRLDESGVLLSEFLEEEPDSLAVVYTLARVRRQQGRPDEAERLYRQAIALQPRLQPVILELSQFLVEQKKVAEALTVLREASEANPSEVVYSHQIVQLLLQANRVAEAQAELELILLQRPDDVEARRKLGILLLEQKNWTRAAKLFGALVAEDAPGDSAYYLGIALENQGKTEEALEAYAKIEKSSNLYADAVAHRSYLLRRAGRVPEAVRILNTALDEGVDRVEFYLYLASLLRQLEDSEAALQVLERGSKVFPSNTRFPYQMGIILDETGRRDLAEQTMHRVLTLDPNHADALNYLAYLWAEQDRNLDQALAYIQKALERKQPGYMIDTLGWVLYKLGRLEEAETQLTNAVSLLAEDMLVLEHLADVYAANGKVRKAIRAYQTILKNNPEQAGVAEKLRALQGD